MPKFGSASQANLDTAHPNLRRVFEEVIKWFDCSVIAGRRGEQAQNEAFHEGRSKVKYPDSKHNNSPSLAVDVVPYPIDWNDKERFYYFAGHVMAVANAMGVRLRWGGDWDGDLMLKDQNFFDLPHYEVIL